MTVSYHVDNDNTMGGFSYSSRVREYNVGGQGGGRGGMGMMMSPYEYDMEMMGGGGLKVVPWLWDDEEWSVSKEALAEEDMAGLMMTIL